jgi:hypothetical protein
MMDTRSHVKSTSPLNWSLVFCLVSPCESSHTRHHHSFNLPSALADHDHRKRLISLFTGHSSCFPLQALQR